MNEEITSLLCNDIRSLERLWPYMDQELAKELIDQLLEKREKMVLAGLLKFDTSGLILDALIEKRNSCLLARCIKNTADPDLFSVTGKVIETKDANFMCEYMYGVPAACAEMLAEAILSYGNEDDIASAIYCLSTRNCKDEIVAQKLLSYLKKKDVLKSDIVLTSYQWFSNNITEKQEEKENPYCRFRQEMISIILGMTNIEVLCNIAMYMADCKDPHLESVLDRIVEIANQAICLETDHIENIVYCRQDNFLVLLKLFPLIEDKVDQDWALSKRKQLDTLKIERGIGAIAFYIEKYNIPVEQQLSFLDTWVEEGKTLPLQFYISYILNQHPYEPIGREIDRQYQEAAEQEITPKTKKLTPTSQ